MYNTSRLCYHHLLGCVCILDFPRQKELNPEEIHRQIIEAQQHKFQMGSVLMHSVLVFLKRGT